VWSRTDSRTDGRGRTVLLMTPAEFVARITSLCESCASRKDASSGEAGRPGEGCTGQAVINGRKQPSIEARFRHARNRGVALPRNDRPRGKAT
jgi:hypothetical protein